MNEYFSIRDEKKFWVRKKTIIMHVISLQSAQKTGRVLVAHEAPLTAGFGAEISSVIQVSLSCFCLL